MNDKDVTEIQISRLKEAYDQAVNDYMIFFCEKHGYDYDDIYWVDYIGGIAEVKHNYFDFDVIKEDVDLQVPNECIVKYYYFHNEAIVNNTTDYSYSGWLKINGYI